MRFAPPVVSVVSSLSGFFWNFHINTCLNQKLAASELNRVSHDQIVIFKGSATAKLWSYITRYVNYLSERRDLANNFGGPRATVTTIGGEEGGGGC